MTPAALPPNTIVACDSCYGSGRCRYPPDLELSKCRKCQGAGKLPLKKVLEHRFY